MQLNLKDFSKKQETLNNIQTAITKLYANDEAFADKESLDILTAKTYDTIMYMEDVFKELITQPEAEDMASKLSTTKEDIANDIIEIMMFSTIARQALIIENFIREE